mmetsp:Transcript_3038/g.6926  ORF Transcript_3038/g.6926 Transcript_3038/m.6926 type:complete len:203 (+) Transcript_3038:6340-6948(+)
MRVGAAPRAPLGPRPRGTPPRASGSRWILTLLRWPGRWCASLRWTSRRSPSWWMALWWAVCSDSPCATCLRSWPQPRRPLRPRHPTPRLARSRRLGPMSWLISTCRRPPRRCASATPQARKRRPGSRSRKISRARASIGWGVARPCFLQATASLAKGSCTAGAAARARVGAISAPRVSQAPVRRRAPGPRGTSRFGPYATAP